MNECRIILLLTKCPVVFIAKVGNRFEKVRQVYIYIYIYIYNDIALNTISQLYGLSRISHYYSLWSRHHRLPGDSSL